MRILFLGPMLGRHANLVPNPAEELAPRLQQRGHTCDLSSSVRNRYVRLFDLLSTIVKNAHRVDVVSIQTYSGPSFLVEDALSWLAQRLGLRIVMVLHGGAMPTFMARHPGWSRRVFARAHRIVTPSGFLADVVAQYGFQAAIIPNAIHIADYPLQIRQKAGPRLLWMRTFHEIYNPQMAVDTLERLLPLYPAATLTMAGQDKGLLPLIKESVKEKELEKHVRFVGFLDKAGKQREFMQHDIFLNTNRVDNMPVSVIEAAAFGLPIVATAVGGVPYLIHDGVNGLLVPNDDPSAMFAATRRILEDENLAVQLSANARVLGERHDWSVVLPQWENLFGEVMEQRP